MTEALSPEGFASLLAGADKPEQPDTDSGAALSTDDEEGTPDAATDVESEAQADESTDEATSDDPETESDRVIKWQTANGEAIEATESELKAGYLRQADYTRKTQEVAQARKEADATIAQQVQVVQALAGEIGEFQALQNQLKAYADVDWDALETNDPQAAAKYYRQWQTLKEKASQAEFKVRQASQHFSYAQHQQFEQGVKQAEAHLTEKVKGITRAEVERTFGALQKLGADGKTLDMVRSNPALAEAVIYANRWIELQDKKPQIANKVKGLPPATVKARPADVKTSGEQIIKAIQGKKSFGADEFAKLLSKVK